MGYMLVYTSMRVNLKKQVFAEISKHPPHALITIVLPHSDKSRLMKGKKYPEIKFNGQMYDVVKKTDNGDFTTYLCIRDIREEQFIRNTNLFIRQCQHGNPLQKTTSLILDNIIKTALIYSNYKLTGFHKLIKRYIPESLIYSPPLLNIFVPPPQVFYV